MIRPNRTVRAVALFCATAFLLVPSLSGGGAPQTGPQPRPIESISADGADRSAVSAARSAVVLKSGSIATRQIVALGRDLEVRGEARSGAAALGGDAVISGVVWGDLVVLGGDAKVQAEARVEGDVYVFGGSLEVGDGGRVAGRTVAFPSAPSNLLLLMEGPALGQSAWSPVVLGAKAALLLAWLTAGLLLLVGPWPAGLWSTGREVEVRPLRCFYVGLVGVATLTLSTLLLSTFAGAVIGVPFVLLVVLVAVILKIWGTVAVLLFFGSRLLERVRGLPAESVHSLLLGLLVLGSIKFLPYVGVWAWSAVTLVGIGATLSTKFGRNQGWLEPTSH